GQGHAAPQDFLQIRPGYSVQAFRGYYQNTNHSPQADFAVTLDGNENNVGPGIGRWGNYRTPAPNEIPPLPPGPYNDTRGTDGVPSLGFTHHLIRDFMFLDATVNNQINRVSPLPPDWPTTDFPYNVVPIALDTSEVEGAFTVGTYTQGTTARSGSYYLLEDS